ncbi:MAG: tetratricopeptide repeat protein [Acidobacteriota bacterium]|nr:tetratricopeptide repeat protein [Acidobacteriota bacterium]MDH3784683.1 tetratricopeptide repeat protein [Acidobacteriota bacterium]
MLRSRTPALVFGFVLLSFLGGSLALAQLSPGKLTGKVVDVDGNPVGGFKLMLEPEDRGSAQPMNVKVNKKGAFSIAFLQSGRWKISTVDDSQFLKSMHYVHRRADGMKSGDFEANGHPTTGLPAFQLGVNGHGHMDLVIAAGGVRERLAKDLRLQEVAGPIKKAVKLYEEGDMKGVVRETDGVLAEEPGLEQALYLRGAARWQLGEYDGAESDLRAALEADPELHQVHGLLGSAILQRAQSMDEDEDGAKELFGEAADLLTEEARRSPDDASVRLNLVVALDSAGRDEELEPALKAVIEDDPSNVDANGRLARLYASSERNDEALAMLESLTVDDRTKADILYNIAVAYYNDQDYDNARTYVQQVVDARPDHALVHRLTGYLRLNAGDRPGAVESLKRYVELAGPDQTLQEQELIGALEKSLDGS